MPKYIIVFHSWEALAAFKAENKGGLKSANLQAGKISRARQKGGTGKTTPVQYLLCKTEQEEKYSLKDPKGANKFHIQIKIEWTGNFLQFTL